eukprot:Hpha_TRINITY_DN16569_c2_g7::TRINITY_DN16569_c2_g7_i1::g.134497::m.134497
MVDWGGVGLGTPIGSMVVDGDEAGLFSSGGMGHAGGMTNTGMKSTGGVGMNVGGVYHHPISGVSEVSCTEKNFPNGPMTGRWLPGSCRSLAPNVTCGKGKKGVYTCLKMNPGTI